MRFAAALPFRHPLVGACACAMTLLLFSSACAREDEAASTPPDTSVISSEGAAAPLAASPTTSPPPTPPSSAAPLPPDLALIGTSAGSGSAGAFFTLGSDEQRYVRLGRRAAPGWTLTRVAPQEVALTDASGAERILRLPDSDEGAEAPRDASGSDARAEEDAEVAVQRLVTTMRLGIEPATTASGRRAYRFTSDPPPPLAAAGLRRGDILVTYDAESFDRSEDVSDLAHQLGSRDRLGLVVERGGRTLKLTASH